MTVEEQVEKLYLEARDDVYYYLLTLNLGPAQAQEAAQEVFLRLYKALAAGDDILNPRAWIFRVAHNLGLKTSARERRTQPLGAELALVTDGRYSGPERALIEKEAGDRLHQAIETLSPQQRQVLFLRAEGLRYHEIAATLGVGTSTVGEFLRRAIRKLRKAVNE